MHHAFLALAVACLPFCASCCPDLGPSPMATPSQYPTGLSEDEKAAIRWDLSHSSCATDSTTLNSGGLSIIFGGLPTPTPSGIDCELRTSLDLPPNTYLRSLTVDARGALEIEPDEILSSLVTVYRECDDDAALIKLGRTHEWTDPPEPEIEQPNGAQLLDLYVGGTALMMTAAETMCDGRDHALKLAISVEVSGWVGRRNETRLDSMDLLADVANCSGPHFESLCEWARLAYQKVASTDDVEPPTLEVVDALARGLTSSTSTAVSSDPSCRDDVPVVRREAERRLRGRRETLLPLLYERCSEPLPSESHDLMSVAAVEERRCLARQALTFLGQSTEDCTCGS